MSKDMKSVRSLVPTLRGLRDRGYLEPGQLETAIKALRRMQHAQRVRDWKRHEQAMNEFAAAFCRSVL